MEVIHDEKIDAIYLKFIDRPYAYGKDLDEERRIDFDINGVAIGVELHCISNGVNLDGLPRANEIGQELKRIGVKEYA